MTVINIPVPFLIILGYLFQKSDQFEIRKNFVTVNSNNTTHVIRTRQVPQATMKTTPDYIRSYGYPAEAHEVTTADGYILTMIRIPFGKDKNLPRKKAIILHHGIFSDSSCWVLNDPDKLLALQLADVGYDVWLANVRGTRYSRRHVKYTVKDKAFFDYSMDEIGKYDVPAEIDYILNATGFQKLQYLGHSMGGLIFHIAMSAMPEYNKKVSLMIGASPAVYNAHATGTAGIAKYLGPKLVKLGLGLLGNAAGQFPHPTYTNLFLLIDSVYCLISLFTPICKFYLDISVGALVQHSPGSIPKGLHTQPSPTSVKCTEHFMQMGYADNFQHYDYGPNKNQEVYGSKTPPLYYLKDTTVPVGVFYGKTDNLVVAKDVSRLNSELPNCVYVKAVGEGRKGSHIVFLVSKDVNELFNKPFIDLALKY